MILLDGAEAKIRDLKGYTIQVIICQVMIQSNVLCFVPAYWVSLYWNTLYWGRGKCNFYKVFTELKSTLLGFAAVKLLCLAFHLMLLEIFSSACLKNSVQLLRSVGDTYEVLQVSPRFFFWRFPSWWLFIRKSTATLGEKEDENWERGNKHILGWTLKF